MCFEEEFWVGWWAVENSCFLYGTFRCDEDNNSLSQPFVYFGRFMNKVKNFRLTKTEKNAVICRRGLKTWPYLATYISLCTPTAKAQPFNSVICKVPASKMLWFALLFLWKLLKYKEMAKVALLLGQMLCLPTAALIWTPSGVSLTADMNLQANNVFLNWVRTHSVNRALTLNVLMWRIRW
jgi:hypothetical protein